MNKKITVYPSVFFGTVAIQPSKSFAHRALICAALAKGKSILSNMMLSEDIKATIRALNAMGLAECSEKNGIVTVESNSHQITRKIADCGESGSTLRFMIPLGLLDNTEYSFTGSERLLNRPLKPYEDICRKNGFMWQLDNNILKVKGKLQPGKYEVAGNISSQFITGLMFALSTLDNDSVIIITTPLESSAYIDLTIAVMDSFGVHIESNESEQIIKIKGSQNYHPSEYIPEADFSHAAFHLVAGAISSGTVCSGLNLNSKQPDAAIINFIKNTGANINIGKGQVMVQGNELKPFTADISQCPDIAPILSILACACKGTSRLVNGARLRFKESDRLRAMAVEITNLGGNVEEGDDYLYIHGTGRLDGGECSAHGDHRVAMSLAVASAICKKPVIIDDYSVVAKSAPEFWDEFIKLGGKFKKAGGN